MYRSTTRVWWRIVYDPGKGGVTAPRSPWAGRAPIPAGGASPPGALLAELLELPQPASEWSRLREESLRAGLGETGEYQLRQAALDRALPVRRRLRAVRLLAPGFNGLPESFLAALARDPEPELRAQTAWLLGLRGGEPAVRPLIALSLKFDPLWMKHSPR